MLTFCRWLATALRRRPGSSPLSRPTRLVLEPLEDRTVPAAVAITTLSDGDPNGNTASIAALIANDGGDGISLREAILAANNTAGADTLTFQPGLHGTLTLTRGQMVIGDPVSITGNGAANTTIDADRMSRIFDVSDTAGNVTLDGLTLLNGHTIPESGGAIRFGSNGTLAIRNCILSGNSTAGFNARGGAIATEVGAVTVSHSTLSGNSTTGPDSNGGAIASLGGAVTVSHSTLFGNAAHSPLSFGGAIFSFSGAVTVSHSTLSSNLGAAIGIGPGGVTVNNSTIVSNSSPPNFAGGGIAGFPGSVIVNNSIVAKNTDSGQGADFSLQFPEVLTVRHSLIGNNTGTALAAAAPDANGNFIGTSASPIDPLLGPLADNGGPTRTHALLAGSPALDRGNNALIPAGVTTDQRGPRSDRIFNGTVDIGAFERHTVTTTALQSSAPLSTYGQSVTFTATVTSTSTPTGGVTFMIDGDSVAGTPSGTTATTATWTFTTSALTAESHTVSAQFVHSGLFENSSGALSGDQVVNKALLTITAHNDTKAHGTVKTFSSTAFTSTGLVNGDAITGVTATSDGAAVSAAAGSYDIVPSAATGTGLSNYTINYVNGTLTVTPPVVAIPVTPAVTIQVKKVKRVTQVIILKDGAVHTTLYPFGKKFTGKVKVHQGDFNGDSLLDVRATATVNGKKKTRTFLTN